MTYQVPTDGQLRACAAFMNEVCKKGRLVYLAGESKFRVQSVRLTGDGWFSPVISGMELVGVHPSEVAHKFRHIVENRLMPFGLDELEGGAQ